MLDKLHTQITRIFCDALEVSKEVDLSQKGSLEMLNVSLTMLMYCYLGCGSPSSKVHRGNEGVHDQ